MDPLPGQLGFDFDDQPAGGAGLVADQPVGDDLPADVCAQTPATLTAGYWRAFSADHPVADALASFRRRFGRDPEQVLQERGILLLGPL